MREFSAAERGIAALATAQHGVVSARQLAEMGFDKDAVARRVRTGRLHRLAYGTYAVGHTVLGPNGRRMAAVLSVRRSMLGCRSATALHGLRRYSGRPELLVVGRGGGQTRRDVVIRHVGHLDAADHTIVDGIPVTSWARSMLDASAVIRDGHRRMVVRAEQLGLFDLRVLQETIARAPRHRGTKPLLAAMAELHADAIWTKSDLEVAMLALCAAHGLPGPVSNTLVEGYEVDFLWRDDRLVGETDTWHTHGDHGTFQSDRRRDRALQLAGYRVLRFTDVDLATRPETVAADLRRALSC